MALGTITVTSQEKKSATAPFDLVLISFAGDGDYLTGGTLFSALMLAALQREVSIAFVTKAGLNGGNTCIYDPAADKLLVEVDSSGVEVADHGNLSGVTFKLIVACY